MIRSHVPCPLDDGRLVPREALIGSRGRPRTCSLPGNSRTLCPLSYARMRRSPPASGRRAAQRTRTPSARIKSPVPVQSGAGSRSGPPPAPGRGGRAGSGAAPGIRTRNLCGLSAAPLPIGLERPVSGCQEPDFAIPDAVLRRRDIRVEPPPGADPGHPPYEGGAAAVRGGAFPSQDRTEITRARAWRPAGYPTGE